MDLIMPSTKSNPTPKHSWQFVAIGTKWEITASREISDDSKKVVTELIDDFDVTYSRFRSDSLVSTIAKTPGQYIFPKSSQELFGFYDELWEITDHQVSPMVGDILASAGYDAEYSLKPDASIKPALDYKKTVRRNGTSITVTESTLIDIGAVGKGYLVDQMVSCLYSLGYDSFVVDGSGDMRIVGEYEETVGLEDPRDTSKILGTVTVKNRALCASANNRRSWGDWHHIIEPSSARPTKEIVATWVIADTAMIADGLATALFFTSPEKLAGRYTYEYMRMHANGSVEYSNNFAKEVF